MSNNTINLDTSNIITQKNDLKNSDAQSQEENLSTPEKLQSILHTTKIDKKSHKKSLSNIVNNSCAISDSKPFDFRDSRPAYLQTNFSLTKNHNIDPRIENSIEKKVVKRR